MLYGLSAGGMLTYHVAAKAPRGTLRGIVGMTFSDQRDQRVRDETSHDKLTARAGVPLTGLLAKTPAASLTYPMSLASKMSALADDPAAMKVLMKDRTSAANRVGVRFLDSSRRTPPPPSRRPSTPASCC
ncbi:hypothetical protein ACFVIY_11995 [Streptomyces sp. NPDC127166]|uniref:hypothetical protein n=1 Tax=Streptomyces sp. NPDC127166 TaxID=3345380 RepID=UPI00363A1362